MSGGLQVKNFDFTLGKSLTVGGFINNNPQRFSINVGQSEDLISLHVDSRFNYGPDKKTIVLNSTREGSAGKWETEQRCMDFNFFAGQYFEMTITYDINKFSIDVRDGCKMEFPNRYSEEVMTFLFLAGDAKLTYVKLE
ncbi:hypothetical protein COCON_G00024540 [Conger conger]|uniref:Galectin n=1 Tax=Conger conger TaxID=82655 RepID=A0A9Q1I5Q4_CONCO|nr:congerin-1-like [Conger conger]KAJ8283604.1 hypothetical protein COCON_G00024540 [Conger conger]